MFTFGLAKTLNFNNNNFRLYFNWCRQRVNIFKGRSLQQHQKEVCITTDASKTMYGGHMGNQFVQGSWSEIQKGWNINMLEMEAVRLTVKHFICQLANKSVLIKSNNTTVVQIINNRGCTKSSHLCIKVWDLWNLAIQHNIYSKAVHICGKTNILADQPSRKKIRATEWTFKQGSCAEDLSHLWDSIDGSVCVSPKPSDANFLHMVSEQIGLCSRCSWENMFAYAFPPLCLIPKVLKHFSQFHCTIILIAPQWPRRHWYTEIIQYLIANFNETPCSSQCSQSATKESNHPQPELFKLTAWKLSTDSSKREAFLRTLENYSEPPGGRVPRRITMLNTNDSVAGVVHGKLILVR